MNEIVSIVIMPLSITRRVLCGAIITACTHLWRNVSTLISALVTRAIIERIDTSRQVRLEVSTTRRKQNFALHTYYLRKTRIRIRFAQDGPRLDRLAGLLSIYVQLQVHDSILFEYQSL